MIPELKSLRRETLFRELPIYVDMRYASLAPSPCKAQMSVVRTPSNFQKQICPDRHGVSGPRKGASSALKITMRQPKPRSGIR